MGRHALTTATPPHGMAVVMNPPRRWRSVRREVVEQYLASLTTGAFVAAVLVFVEVWA